MIKPGSRCVKELKDWDPFRTFNFLFYIIYCYVYMLVRSFHLNLEISLRIFATMPAIIVTLEQLFSKFKIIKNFLGTAMRQSDWVVLKFYQLKGKSAKELIFKLLFIILLERKVIELSYSELINRFANRFNTYYYYYNIFFIFQKSTLRNYLSLLFLLSNFCSWQYNNYLLHYRKIEWLHDTEYLI